MLSGGTATAETPLLWTAPSACPSKDAVVERIARRVPPGVAIEGVRVVVTTRNASYSAQVELGERARALTSPRCDELVDAIAIVVARQLVERAEARPRAARATTRELGFATAPSLPSLPPLALESPGAVPARSAAPWRGGIRALALSGIGMQPRVGVGGELAAYLQRGEWFGELGYARWLESSAYLTQGAPGGVSVGLHFAALRGGWSSRRMPLRGWAGVEVGELTGAGVGLVKAAVGEGRWTAIASGFGVGWPISRRIHLVGTFEIAAPLQRARFLLGDGSEIYQPSSASARCALGFGVSFR
jgi:hypothetical protein